MNNQSSGDTGYDWLCDRCGFVYSRRYNLERHLVAIHGMEEVEAVVKREDGVECEECGKVFVGPRSLKGHKNKGRCKGMYKSIDMTVYNMWPVVGTV